MDSSQDSGMAKGKQPVESRPSWTQAYVMAAFSLVLGVMLGYLFRGSPPPSNLATSAPSSSQSLPANNSLPSLLGGSAGTQGAGPQSTAALDGAAAPMIEALSRTSSDFDTLVKLGNLY